MTNRAARVRQREIDTAIRAAKKAGATEIELKIGNEAWIRIPVTSDRLPRDNASSGSSWDDRYVDGKNAIHQAVSRSTR